MSSSDTRVEKDLTETKAPAEVNEDRPATTPSASSEEPEPTRQGVRVLQYSRSDLLI